MNDKNSSAPFEESELKKARKSEAAQREKAEDAVPTEQRKFRNYVFPALVFLVGVSISFYSYFGSSSYEDIRVREAFEEEAFHDITSAVVNRLDNVLSAVEDVSALFSASEFISRQEFKTYVKHELETNPGIHMFRN